MTALAIIDDVIAGRRHAPELGGPIRSTIRHLAIEDTLEGHEAELVRRAGLGGRLVVVADQNTADILGRQVARALPSAELLALDHPHADEPTADALQDRTRHADALVAIGSGTINDLCKYAAFRSRRQSAVFATAPSMDGYVTSTVSITRDGLKLSLPAQAPAGVFFDLAVLRQAPRRMILAGLGDTVCRTTAQLDWLLSHRLLGTSYAQTPYDLMREDEPVLYARAAALPGGAPDAMLSLTRLLVLSGLGVLVTGTSHCGSMSEHSISHYIDMLARPHPGTLHGQQVGIASWTMARLQTRMLAFEGPPALRPLREDPHLEARFGRFAPACRKANAAKPFDQVGAVRVNERLQRDWPAIRAELLAAMLPLETLAQVAQESGMPVTASALGLPPACYREAVGHAHELRDRYGFLDFAAQAGMLAEFAAGET